jgi:hypothetical protein
VGIREEETGEVVTGPAVIGEPWWLLSKPDGTAFCCHVAPSWFKAREIGQGLTGQSEVSAELIFQGVTK